MNSKDILQKVELTSEQLASLRGGIDTVAPTDPVNAKQNNINKYENCKCEYHSPDASNSNGANGCQCVYVPSIDLPSVTPGDSISGEIGGIALPALP